MATAKVWYAEEVARRWNGLWPPKEGYNKSVQGTKAWIRERATDLELGEEAYFSDAN